MLFSSLVFICFFLPVVYILFRIVPWRYKNVLLLISSIFFYAWGEPRYVFLMIITIFINWVLGICIEEGNTKRTKVTVLILAILMNLLILGYYKYTDLVISTFNVLLGKQIELRSIVLPIGISFFTFQAMSYIIDLYRGKYKAQRNFLNLALYISFFPQLIAGPIVRYSDINQQLNWRELTENKTMQGIRRFIYGLAKKVLIANTLAEGADYIFELPISELTGVMAWIGALLYTLQIYYDFSGYSDMAIGLGKMFGFDFLENFNYPYLSKTISEFWRRWHISLGTWFKEYLYIPLGGNRKGTARTLINLLIVFAVTGIWHGASWNFLAWGIYYGIIIVIERIGIGSWMCSRKIIGYIYSLLIIVIGWVIFRVESIENIVGYLIRMFFPWRYVTSNYSILEFISHHTILILIFAVLGCGIIQIFMNRESIQKLKYGKAEFSFCIVLLLSSLLKLVSGTYNPFIYFRF